MSSDLLECENCGKDIDLTKLPDTWLEDGMVNPDSIVVQCPHCGEFGLVLVQES